jgi:hypothetical protein
VAYSAKTLCSGVFVSGRPAESVLSADLAVDDLAFLRHINAIVNRNGAVVTATFAGVLGSAARYRPGLGCSLAGPDSVHAPGIAAPAAEDSGGPIRTESSEPAVDDGTTDGRLSDALDWAFAEPNPRRLRRTRAVVVVRNGKVVAERYAPGFGRQMPLAGWSMAKSAMNALTGILVREGRLSLASKVPTPEWVSPDDPRRQITLRHLLNMESGLEFSEDYGNPLQDVTRMLMQEPDAAAYSAGKPLAAAPGTRWHYASGTTNILSRWIRQLVGEADYPAFPARVLFQPLGMDSAVLEQDTSGNFVGSSFMYATARDWARLGLLYLQDGVWEGRRILPEGWVRFSVTPAPRAPDRQYGAHFWLKLNGEEPASQSGVPRDAFHALGFEGQYLTVVPSLNLVIVRLGLTRYSDAWQHGEWVRRIVAAL